MIDRSGVRDYAIHVMGRRWLTEGIFEIRFDRPAGFDFLPGQKIGFKLQGATWDYTLLGPAQDPALSLCVRHIPEGRFSPRLAAAQPGEPFQITSASGFFTFKPSPRPAVFVATGTGVAPFVAFARRPRGAIGRAFPARPPPEPISIFSPAGWTPAWPNIWRRAGMTFICAETGI
ncbi:MAG: hypothetical protein HZB24_00055 [Desulfobacterales bacterium]|nr:hypothetical protein [Desulfobacterales bacterium]